MATISIFEQRKAPVAICQKYFLKMDKTANIIKNSENSYTHGASSKRAAVRPAKIGTATCNDIHHGHLIVTILVIGDAVGIICIIMLIFLLVVRAPYYREDNNARRGGSDIASHRTVMKKDFRTVRFCV